MENTDAAIQFTNLDSNSNFENNNSIDTEAPITNGDAYDNWLKP